MPDVWKSIMFLCSINQFCDQFGLVSSRCSNDHASPLLAWTPLAPECIIWQTISLILTGGWKLILTNSWKLTSTCGKWNLSSWWNLMMIYFSTSETVSAPSFWQMYGLTDLRTRCTVIAGTYQLFMIGIYYFHCRSFFIVVCSSIN